MISRRQGLSWLGITTLVHLLTHDLGDYKMMTLRQFALG